MGYSLKIETDTVLMNDLLSFVFFLIVIDYVYDIDEDVKLCDGYLFAGFGLMTAQKVIPQWVIISALTFLFWKTIFSYLERF